MKRVIFLLLTVVSFSVFSQEDFFWNSLLPNGMDLSVATSSSLYTMRTIQPLANLQDIVATAFKGDTLFATDGQTLYVIVNDTLRSQYTLNKSKAGRDQAFIVTLFYGSNRVTYIVTSVDDSLKLFRWPDISNPTVLATGIEPVIYVYSELNTSNNNLNIAYLAGDGNLTIWTQSWDGAGSLSQPTIKTIPVVYQSPVDMIRISEQRFAVIVDKDSTLIYVYRSDADAQNYYKLVVKYDWKPKDVLLMPPSLFNDDIIFGTDTAVIVEAINDYYDSTNIYDDLYYFRKVFRLPQGYRLGQFIPDAYGHLLIYPSQPDSLYVIYNLYDEDIYYLMRSGGYIASPYPYPMNLVAHYNPVFYFDTEPHGMSGCQTVAASIHFRGYYVDYSHLNVDLPEPGKSVFIQDTVVLSSFWGNTLLTHWQDTLAIVSTYLFGYRPAIQIMEVQDTFAGLQAVVDAPGNSRFYDTYGNLRWYYKGALIDTNSYVRVSRKGNYTLRIQNSKCSVDTQVSVILGNDVNYLNSFSYVKPEYTVDNGILSFQGFQGGYVVGDTLKLNFSIDTSNFGWQPSSIDALHQYRKMFFVDGQPVSVDSNQLTIIPPFSGDHYIDVVFVPSDLSSGYLLIDYRTGFTVISPHIRPILQKRKYAVGDTAYFKISGDSLNTDIYIDDRFSTNVIYPFKNVGGDRWEADVFNKDAQGHTITNPDSLAVILFIATNRFDRIKLTLKSPDGKEAVFYNGMNTPEGYPYIIGNPYSIDPLAMLNLWDFNGCDDSLCMVGMFPLYFTPLSDSSLGSDDFMWVNYSDCVVDSLPSYVFRYESNSFKADFSTLSGATVNGKWQLVVDYPHDDSTWVKVYPILRLPPQVTQVHYLKDTGSRVLHLNIDKVYDPGKMDEVYDNTFIMKEKGDVDLKFIFTFNLFESIFPQYFKDEYVKDDLHTDSAWFDIQIRKQPVYYDSKTYSFSPNGDGINDYWNPISTIAKTYPVLQKAPLSNLTVVIVDQQGRAIKRFVMSDSPMGWDGRDRNGRLVPAGIYWYFIIYRDQKYYGTVLIMK